ncbi:MAG TPA: ATPase domain-containing protein [Candidatus Dormibacteraeota bacterium]|nr:ATPase domain-containing protein [Candidatus Dormibacteraeota bacterium]
MQEARPGFKLQVPSLENQAFLPGTVVLLIGRPGIGKSAFAQQFCREGLKVNEKVILALTDKSADSVKSKFGQANDQFHVVDFLLEKPAQISDISITVHQMIAKFEGQPARLAFDSLSTLGTMFSPAYLAPWLLDQRARFLKSKANILAMIVYDTGINPPSITRSLQALSDVVLEMKLDESSGERTRMFRVFSSRGAAHSAKWYPFTISDTGISFGEPS